MKGAGMIIFWQTYEKWRIQTTQSPKLLSWRIKTSDRETGRMVGQVKMKKRMKD